MIVLHEGRIILDGPPSEVLVNPLLDEIGIDVSRYTLAARRGTLRNLWPSATPLPVTLDQAVAGFERSLTERAVSER